MKVKALGIFLICLFMPAGTVNSQDVPTPNELVSIWQNWQEILDSRGGVKINSLRLVPDGSEFSRMESTSVDLINGEFRLSRGETIIQGQPKKVWCRFTNSRYGATVEQSPSGGWKLIEVAPVIEYTGAPQSSGGISWLSEQFLDALVAGTKIDTRMSAAGNLIVRIDDIQPFDWVEIEAARETSWLPVSFLFSLTNAGNDSIVSRTTYEYELAESTPLIKQWKIGLNHPDTGEEYFNRTEYSFQETTKPSNKECYLTNYGLPEPKWAQANNRWWYIAGAIMFGVVAFVAWRKIQSKE